MFLLSRLSILPREIICEYALCRIRVRTSIKHFSGFNILKTFPSKPTVLQPSFRCLSSSKDTNQGFPPKLTQRDRLKQAIKDYGATIFVFHIILSLASLGICYIAISNGVDASKLLKYIGFSEAVLSSKLATGGSTFVMAYAVHKLIMPVRIGITIPVAPFIVKYLRSINVLKVPKPKM